MQKILVTGAAGRLGRAICAAAASRYRVVGFDAVQPEGLDGIEAHLGDVRDPGALARAAEGCTAVIHTAALMDKFIGRKERSEFFEVNVAGTDHVCQAAWKAGAQKIIYSSSMDLYGFETCWEEFGARIIDEQTPVCPRTIYGLTKYLAEEVVRGYARNHGLRVACLRYMAFNDKPPEKLGLKLLARYLWIQDVAEANLACVASERFDNEVFLIGPRTPLGPVDVVEGVGNPEAVLERHWPGSVKRLREAEVRIPPNSWYPVASIAKAGRLLDWTPSYTFSDYLAHLERNGGRSAPPAAGPSA